MENNFPKVRNQILREGVSSWINHKEFLLAYMQMIRARSPLFFDEWGEQAKAMRLSIVTEGLPEGNLVKVDYLEERPMTKGEIQNWTISKMRDEIKKGSDWMTNFHWALRYTDSPFDPVITAEQPLVTIGTTTDVVTAMEHPDTMIYFPICWQAFLFGSIRRFDVETDRFVSSTLEGVRRAYIENGRKFLVSPQKLASL